MAGATERRFASPRLHEFNTLLDVLTRTARSNSGLQGRHLVAHKQGDGRYHVCVFPDRQQAIAYRDRLPEDQRHSTLQPFYVRKLGDPVLMPGVL